MLSNFTIKPIQTTAERLEKIANMKIDDINIDESSDNNSLPTSKVVRETIMGETEKYLPLEAETEWIFDGGDASSGIDILYKIDDVMSDTSNNAVKNKIIKKYVDDKAKDTNKKIENIETDLSYVADYVVEEAISGIWNYTKWASGKIELWTNSIPHTINFTNYGSIFLSAESGILVPIVTDIKSVNGDSTHWHYVNWASVTKNGNSNSKIDMRYYGINENGNGDTIKFSAYVIGRWK